MEKEIDYAALGMRIRAIRKEKHITQEKLGEICDLSTAHIGHIERGTRIPSLDTLFRISQALDISIDYMIFDSVAANSDLFGFLDSVLKNKDKRKVKTFLTAVKALAERIDDF